MGISPCQTCGQPKTSNRAAFCTTCRKERWRASFLANPHPRRKMALACEHCGKATPHRKRKTCSDECRAAMISARMVGNDHAPRRDASDLPPCKRCGKPVDRPKRSYCDDPECRKASKRAHMLGKPYSGKTRGVPKSEEWREKFRDRFEREKCRWPTRGHRSPYKGISLRSSWEWRVAWYLDSLGIRWEYESRWLEIDGVRYLPDFYLPDTETFVEVKGRWKPGEEEKFARFAARWPIDLWMKEELEGRGLFASSVSKLYREAMSTTSRRPRKTTTAVRPAAGRC
jgi:hypothetical protein